MNNLSKFTVKKVETSDKFFWDKGWVSGRILSLDPKIVENLRLFFWLDINAEKPRNYLKIPRFENSDFKSELERFLGSES